MAEKKIDKLDNLSVPCTSTADVYIKKIFYEGDPSDSKRPIAFQVAFEKTNQMFKVVTWDFGSIDLIKSAFANKKICTISFYSTEYKDGLSHKLNTINVSDKTTSHTEDIHDNNDNKFNAELYQGVIKNISDPDFKLLIDELIMKNSNFFVWPAAKSIHHAFPGGLAQHSYMVAVNAMNLANTYSALFPVNYDLLITGALIHDIGKLKEYNQSGLINFEGQLMSHLVYGVEMIDEACDKLKLNKNDMKFLQLKHIIVSHHQKLEFGSPNTPILVEAHIISMADNLDASLESMAETLENINTNEISKPVIGLDGAKVCKLF